MVIVITEAEKKEILKYDIDALRKNIRRHELNIEIFQQEIDKARQQIALLLEYIKIIERERGKVK